MADTINIDCSYQSLSSVSDLSLLSGIQIHRLHLDKNIITEIPAAAFDGPIISGINLNFNPLTNISASAFSGQEHLQFLMLRQTRLEVSPRLFLSRLDRLEVLELSDIQTDLLATVTKETFPTSTALVELSMNYCRITRIADDAFDAMNTLTMLLLRENKLTSIPAAMKSLNKLRELDLSLNKMESVAAEDLEGMDDLEILKLDSNTGLRLDDGAFDLLKNSLRKLSLSWLDLPGVPTNSIQHLRNLRELDLSGNLISELEDDAFLGLEHLEMLDLSNNLNMQISSHKAFNGLQTSLTKLVLRKVSLSSISVEAFSSFKMLQSLDLSRNKLTTIEDVANIKATALDLSFNQISVVLGPFSSGPLKLDLRGNSITQVSFIHDVCQFEELRLEGNLVNCTCDLSALAAVPGVEVTGDCSHPNTLAAEAIQSGAAFNFTVENCNAGLLRDEECDWQTSNGVHIKSGLATMLLTLIFITF
jgi:Leucine-rich repeat (LRR) protein